MLSNMTDRDDKQDIPNPILAPGDENIPEELPPTEGMDMETTFEWMAKRRAQRLSVPRSQAFSRTEVMHAFQEAFELIGGVPRLAMWGHNNETEFYRLYSKLFPNQVTGKVQHAGEIKMNIISAIPKTDLDNVTLEGEYAEVKDGS